jgi:hypothetical protein
MTPEEKRVKAAENAKRWRERHPEAYRASKQKYYASEKGKACKKREEASYVASGGRAAQEVIRAQKPISEAKKLVKLRYQIMRRSGEKVLDDFDSWVLNEAIELAGLRKRMCGGEWHVDHVTPVSKGGKSTHDNIQVVPAYWNRVKSNKHSERFFAHAR